MKKILLQAIKFFGVSGIGWLMDMCIYITLTTCSISEVISNIISSFVAVTFVYCVSTRKLFVNTNVDIGLKKKYVLYIIYQIIMVLLSSTIIGLITKGLVKFVSITLVIKYAQIIAKIIVTPFTMIINFIFMKFLIERV